MCPAVPCLVGCVLYRGSRCGGQVLFVVCVGVPASLALSVEGSSRWRGRRGTGNMSLNQRRHTHLHLSTQIDLTSVVHCIHCGHPHPTAFLPEWCCDQVPRLWSECLCDADQGVLCPSVLLCACVMSIPLSSLTFSGVLPGVCSGGVCGIHQW